MATEMLPRDAALAASVAGRVLLIWQNPTTRWFSRVGALERLTDGRYAFRYLPAAEDPAFYPLAEFPKLDAIYVSTDLPAFFGNRVMSRQRESYEEFRRWIGLDSLGADTPFEVLVRTGGPRATDTFHVVDDLFLDSEGSVVSRFLASGVRHIPGATDRLARLEVGTELALRDDPENPVNDRAILMDVVADLPVGFIPDWLVDDVHELRERSSSIRIFAERINPDAPPHLRLLCRLEAHPL